MIGGAAPSSQVRQEAPVASDGILRFGETTHSSRSLRGETRCKEWDWVTGFNVAAEAWSIGTAIRRIVRRDVVQFAPITPPTRVDPAISRNLGLAAGLGKRADIHFIPPVFVGRVRQPPTVR